MAFTPVIIESIYDYQFNFKRLLKYKDTIIWRNCENLEITIKSKINKLIFENCKNIKIIMCDAIIGVEFNKCNDIKLKIKKDKIVNSIETFLSNVELKIYKQNINFITFFTENSKLKFISHFN